MSPHPLTPCDGLESLEARISWTADRELRLSYWARGAISDLAIPEPSALARTDELWRRTCFEAFLRPEGGEAYVELNLSPSGAWAAYRFSRYRDGMEPLEPVDMRSFAFRSTEKTLALEVSLQTLGLEGPCRVALSAVIEEAHGRKSYWALAHPPAQPDFHHPGGFVLDLPAR